MRSIFLNASVVHIMQVFSLEKTKLELLSDDNEANYFLENPCIFVIIFRKILFSRIKLI